MGDPWNSLEVTKLLAGLLTPIAVAGLGVYLNRVSKRFELLQWRSQKLTEKRLAIYDDLAPDFNDLLCYFTYVGSWRDFDPPQIVALKRIIDKKVHLAAPLFSPDFFDSCSSLLNLCFQTFTGLGRDARLRTSFEVRRGSRPTDWKDEWAANFAAEELVSNPEDIQTAYQRIMNVFARDIGVNPDSSTS